MKTAIPLIPHSLHLLFCSNWETPSGRNYLIYFWNILLAHFIWNCLHTHWLTGFKSLNVFDFPETFQIMRQTRAHEGSVFTLCTLQGGGLLSGGGKDRKIIRWSADLAPERECEVNHSCMCVWCCWWSALLSYIQTTERMLINVTICADSRKVWGSSYHCRCGWGGTVGWYNA